MAIDIIGYVTEPLVNHNFTIKVTSDEVGYLSFSDIQVSKEVRIYISPYLYLSDNESEFKRLTVEEVERLTAEESERLTAEEKSRIDRINKCLAFGNALGRGDQIECSVFIVEPEIRNGRETYTINRNRKDIETYADFPLWLYSNDVSFRRSESDSRESLKFRKQWRYTCINREKYKKITGYTLFGYRDKKWVNKNPKITFPILWWIQVKTTASNLWRRFTRQENLSKTSITHKPTTINTVVTIIAIVVTVIAIVIAIWFR